MCQCLGNIRCIARKIEKICVDVWATLNKLNANAEEFMQNEQQRLQQQQQQRQHKDGEEKDAKNNDLMVMIRQWLIRQRSW